MTCGKHTDANSNEDSGCGQHFTQTPGKIHKLYRRLFSQLEFRCPNSHHGCAVTLKYDQVDRHLRQECEYREVQCPNGCTDNQNEPLRMAVKAMEAHVAKDCPRVVVECPQRCGKSMQRGQLIAHLEECTKESMLHKSQHTPRIDDRSYESSMRSARGKELDIVRR